MDKKILMKALDKYVEQKLRKYPRKFIDDLKKALAFRIDKKLEKGEKLSIRIFDRNAKQQNVTHYSPDHKKDKLKERSL